MGALLGGGSLLLGALPAQQDLKKRANNRPFALNPRSLGQPGLDGASAVFSFCSRTLRANRVALFRIQFLS
ncbi:hypothetical protein [Pseudomonas fluorescens]|uniref:hypothetical protein n=1 Tax=Pseudomonas fluorescens TaxID=294 RepID=UPI0015927B95|nr:hypothetical protein [Pseudomonas fluorescens]